LKLQALAASNAQGQQIVATDEARAGNPDRFTQTQYLEQDRFRELSDVLNEQQSLPRP
jgi:hypothetical protein